MLPRSLEEYYNRLAADLPDEDLQRELNTAVRQMSVAVRTRKELARRRAYCYECELKRRAEQRDIRNPGHA